MHQWDSWRLYLQTLIEHSQMSQNCYYNYVLIAKFLIMTIQVNLVLNPREWRRQHKFVWIVIIKIFSINNLPSEPFLDRQFEFHNFFHNGLLRATHLFKILAVFELDFILLCYRNAFKLQDALKNACRLFNVHVQLLFTCKVVIYSNSVMLNHHNSLANLNCTNV